MKLATGHRFCIAIALAGTAEAASLSGLVRDPSGWEMPHVQLTLTLQGTSAASLTAETDSAGKFMFSGVASGVYDLQAQAKAFVLWKMEVRVAEGQEVNLPPIVLQVGGTGCGGEVKILSRFGAMMRRIKWFFAPPDPSKVILCQ
jgi:hypothetical protein